MRFVMLYTPDKSKDRSLHIPRTLAKMDEMTASGTLITSAGIAFRDSGAARIRQVDGSAFVERPPAGDSALFGADGFILIQAADFDEAVRLATDFIAAAGDGVIELGQLIDPPGDRA